MPIYEFDGRRPQIGAETFIHPEAVLIGDVRIGRGCLVCAGAVLRGDFGEIVMGDGSNAQDNAVIHMSPGGRTVIGRNVIIGHSAILHDAVIEDGGFVGMGAVLLPGAVVESGAMAAAGAVVPSRFRVPAGKIAAGNPAEIQKDVSEPLRQMNQAGLKLYQDLTARYLQSFRRVD